MLLAMDICVSIPHRYDKNVLAPVPEYSANREFQSLIGTIKTHRDSPDTRNPYKFQSLLIGTIKTTESRRSIWSIRNVSIPHRYDKNTGGGHAMSPHRVVSIPHRYDKNFVLTSADDLKDVCFNPS